MTAISTIGRFSHHLLPLSVLPASAMNQRRLRESENTPLEHFSAHRAQNRTVNFRSRTVEGETLRYFFSFLDCTIWYPKKKQLVSLSYRLGSTYAYTKRSQWEKIRRSATYKLRFIFDYVKTVFIFIILWTKLVCISVLSAPLLDHVLFARLALCRGTLFLSASEILAWHSLLSGSSWRHSCLTFDIVLVGRCTRFCDYLVNCAFEMSVYYYYYYYKGSIPCFKYR